MGTIPRMTMPVMSILSAMLERPDEEWYGLELAERAELKSGTIYPALLRLEQADWLESRWEDVEPSEVGRPRRRMYRLTGEGLTTATAAVAQLQRLAGDFARTSAWARPDAGAPGEARVTGLFVALAMAVLAALLVAEVKGGLFAVAKHVVRAAARRLPRDRGRGVRNGSMLLRPGRIDP